VNRRVVELQPSQQTASLVWLKGIVEGAGFEASKEESA
jgi:hypothetical protein